MPNMVVAESRPQATEGKENLRKGAHRVEVEPTPRRVRVEFNGQTIADSRRAVLLRESNLLPVYYFPPEDVRSEFLTGPTEQHTRCPYKGEASYWTITVGDKVLENAMWGYLDPLPGREDIRGYRAFYWNKMDHWYEEDEEVFKHPRDPYHRVDVLQSSRAVRVEINRQHPVRARHRDQVRDQLGRDRRARTGFPVLPGIAEIGHDRGDPSRRRALQRVDHDQQLHQIVVGRKGGRLDDEGVAAAHVLQNFYKYFEISKASYVAAGQRLAEISGNSLCDFWVGVAR